jgi:hypothetical protein
MKKLLATSMLMLTGAATLGGCASREGRAPAASPAIVAPSTIAAPTTAERVVSYPEGRYELRGEGTAIAPYYWVWIPTGATPPDPTAPGRAPTK